MLDLLVLREYWLGLICFLKSKLCTPSPKGEFVHKMFVSANIDHRILQNRHMKSCPSVDSLGFVCRCTIPFQPMLTVFMQLLQYRSVSMDSPTSKYAICVGTFPHSTQNLLFIDRRLLRFSGGFTNDSIRRAFLGSVTIFFLLI